MLLTIQELLKAQCNNTDINNTDYSDTDPFLSVWTGWDWMGLELTNHISLLLVIIMTIFRKNLRKTSKEIAKHLEFVDVMR